MNLFILFEFVWEGGEWGEGRNSLTKSTVLGNANRQPSSKWVLFFEPGKDNAARGEGSPPSSRCAQDIVGL